MKDYCCGGRCHACSYHFADLAITTIGIIYLNAVKDTAGHTEIYKVNWACYIANIVIHAYLILFVREHNRRNKFNKIVLMLHKLMIVSAMIATIIASIVDNNELIATRDENYEH